MGKSSSFHFLLLFQFITYVAGTSFVSCKRNYKKVGCFVDQHLGMDLLVNDRQISSPKHQKGHVLIWNKFPESIHSLACRCAKEAENGGYVYFAIRYWAECYGGKDEAKLASLKDNENKRSHRCYNYQFKSCDDAHERECVGDQASEYIFSMKTGHSFTTCKRNYKKEGCFVDQHLGMDLLVNDRSKSSPKHQKGHILVWTKFPESIHSLACRCAKEAENGGYAYFVIRYWAECYGGKDEAKLAAIKNDETKRSNGCYNHEFKSCDDAEEQECVGARSGEYAFSIIKPGESIIIASSIATAIISKDIPAHLPTPLPAEQTVFNIATTHAMHVSPHAENTRKTNMVSYSVFVTHVPAIFDTSIIVRNATARSGITDDGNDSTIATTVPDTTSSCGCESDVNPTASIDVITRSKIMHETSSDFTKVVADTTILYRTNINPTASMNAMVRSSITENNISNNTSIVSDTTILYGTNINPTASINAMERSSITPKDISDVTNVVADTTILYETNINPTASINALERSSITQKYISDVTNVVADTTILYGTGINPTPSMNAMARSSITEINISSDTSIVPDTTILHGANINATASINAIGRSSITQNNCTVVAINSTRCSSENKIYALPSTILILLCGFLLSAEYS